MIRLYLIVKCKCSRCYHSPSREHASPQRAVCHSVPPRREERVLPRHCRFGRTEVYDDAASRQLGLSGERLSGMSSGTRSYIGICFNLMWLKLQSVIPFWEFWDCKIVIRSHLLLLILLSIFVLIPLTICFVCFQDLVKQVLSALRAIAGNDDVKDAIVNAGGTELIVMAVNRHMSNAQVTALLSSDRIASEKCCPVWS